MAGLESLEDRTRKHTNLVLTFVAISGLLMFAAGMWASGNIYLNTIFPLVILIPMMFAYKKQCVDGFGYPAETAGDNVYYLGFLFTVSALAAGIIVVGIKLQSGHDEASAGMAIVSFLPSFGTALVTTIVGLCLRVSMSQDQGDADAEYDEMNNQLRIAAQELTFQAGQASDHFKQFIVGIRQRTDELEREFSGYSDNLSKRLSDDSVSQVLGQIELSAESLVAAAKELENSTSTINVRLEPSLQRLSAASIELKESTKESLGFLTQSIVRAEESSWAHSDELSKQTDAVEQLSEKVGSIDMKVFDGALRESARELKESIATIAEQLDPAIESLSNAAGEMTRETNRSMERISAGVEGIRRTLDDQARIVAKHGLPRTGSIVNDGPRPRPNSPWGFLGGLGRFGLRALKSVSLWLAVVILTSAIVAAVVLILIILVPRALGGTG